MKLSTQSKLFYRATVILFFTFYLCNAANAEQNVPPENTLKIGVDLGISSILSEPVADIINGINLAKEALEERGGIAIGDKKYPVEIIKYDNKGDISTASQLAIQAITKDRINALIMPLFSDIAVQVSRVANGYRIPAVCLNTTSPKITLNHPYAFRTSPSYAEMARATRELAETEWQAKKVAALYNEQSGYSTDMVQAVLAEFSEKYGAQSIVAVKTFKGGELDFHQQLTEIIAANPDFLYVPEYINEVSVIVKEARKMGWKKPITGSDVWELWGAKALMDKCGDHCKNLFYTGSFVTKGAEGDMAVFAKAYRDKYKKDPTSNAAYGYEAFNIIVNAFEKMESLSGDLRKDRTSLRDAIAKTNYTGAIGKIFYQGTGEPVTCPVVVKIDDAGEFTQHFISCTKN